MAAVRCLAAGAAPQRARSIFGPAADSTFDSPTETGEAFDEFVSDPAKPVPYTNDPSTGYPRAYPIEDQRFVASRPDVLVYETEPLAEDLTFVGPLDATLHVSTTGTDADWIVKLVDVYPGDYPNPDPNPADVKLGGYQQLVRGDVFRGKFRNSFERPEPFTPGQVTQIAFTLPDVCHTFRSRPPRDGAGSKHVVPAGGPQSADLREHSDRETRGLPQSHPPGLPGGGRRVRPDRAGLGSVAES